MARGDNRMGIWKVLLTISMVTMPLTAHGRHVLAGVGRRQHHHNHSSVNREAFNTRMVLSDDSAERDHLIGAGLGLGAGLPLSSSSGHRSHKRLHLDLPDEDHLFGEEFTAGGAGPVQPGDPASDDIITVAFHSPAPDAAPSDISHDLPQALGGGPTAWTLSDFYDYLSPDDDLSALDTTPDPEPSPSPPADMEDENPLLAEAVPVVPQNVKPNVESRPSVPGPDEGQGLGLGGAVGNDGCRLGLVRSGPGVCVSQCDVEPDFCFNGGMCTVVAGMGAFCRCNVQEYIWNKGARCDWAITEFQVMCVVVGMASLVLLLLFMIIVFFAKRLHHLKNENNRLRKRSKYRPQGGDPQTDGLSVSTMADGSLPNVRKLCDTPPPPPQAHAHNLAYYDNIICQKPAVSSYTWEYMPRNPYNHHKDEPQKQEELVKSPPPKEEESLNIRNSQSPKQENQPIAVDHDHGDTPNHTEESAENGVTIGLELLLPKEAQLRPETSPPLQYDVFLYKLTNNGEPPPTGLAPTNHASGGSKHPLKKHPNPHKSPRMPKSPKAPKFLRSPKHVPERKAGPHQPLSSTRSSPGHYPSSRFHSSTSRHSVPGCYSFPNQAVSQQPCQASHSSPQLRRPQGLSQDTSSECCGTGARMGSSPSSPHLAQPSPSPSWCQYSPASTRSLPPLS